MGSIAADLFDFGWRSHRGKKDPGRFSQLPRSKRNCNTVVPAGCGYNTCLRHFTGQEIGKCAPDFERACVLQELQLEHKTRIPKTELLACDLDDGRRAYVGTYETFC